jgi:hypothetical protein
VVAAAAVLITSAGAGTAAMKIDLSTRAGAIKYLKSIGVDPTGVVIQRGARNYAGPKCPGRAWRCTSSKRVFQIAATGVNKYQCTGGTGSSTDPLTCTTTQNVATCTEDESTVPSSTETCTIVQTNTTGSNSATVTQKITQNVGTEQHANQMSFVDQQNVDGPNTALVTQNINQSANSPSGTMQTATQSSCVDQHGIEASSDPCFDGDDSVASTGADKSTVNQSVTQNGGGAVSGSNQTQTDDITGHVTQLTTGLATNQNTQNEHQNLGGNGNQSQDGPLICCSDQGTNPGDKFNINQIADQNASNPDAAQNDELIGQCFTTGLCKVTESASDNGGGTKNSCSGTDCSIGIVCASGGGGGFAPTTGGCTPCTPDGEGGCSTGCFPECGPGFATFRYNSRPVALAARRLLAQYH